MASTPTIKPKFLQPLIISTCNWFLYFGWWEMIEWLSKCEYRIRCVPKILALSARSLCICVFAGESWKFDVSKWCLLQKVFVLSATQTLLQKAKLHPWDFSSELSPLLSDTQQSTQSVNRGFIWPPSLGWSNVHLHVLGPMGFLLEPA